MIKQTLKDVAPADFVAKQKNNGNNKEVLAFRIKEHSAAVIDTDAVQAAKYAEIIKTRQAERRHLSAIIEVA